jgi:uncharacterized membrane protein YgdD (TMEM256/DUF423 family)
MKNEHCQSNSSFILIAAPYFRWQIINMGIMAKWILFTAGILGATAVTLGAFGAHALKARLDEYSIGIYRTGVEYQYYHVLALLAVGLLALKYPGGLLQWSAISFVIGMFFFSGSLYLLATRSLLGIESWSSILGPVTPLGGLFFIAGWILLSMHVLKNI